MREIKFRFWHTHRNGVGSMQEVVELSPNGELMQFTGLKDKNGREIYEGDIIDFGGLKPIEIVWRNCSFETKLIPHENSNPITLTQEGLSAFGEVIGNVWENPELLKQ